MIIVSGWLTVAAEDRASYLANCLDVITTARAAPGCAAFYLCGDPIDNERINVFEQWDSADAVEQFRGSRPTDDQGAKLIGAHVMQHDIAGTTSLTS